MGLLDSKHNEIQTDELLTKPLELEPPVKNAVNYLRKIGPKLVKWRPEKVRTEQTPPFEDLQTVIEAVDTLDDDLEANPNNTKP